MTIKTTTTIPILLLVLQWYINTSTSTTKTLTNLSSITSTIKTSFYLHCLHSFLITISTRSSSQASNFHSLALHLPLVEIILWLSTTIPTTTIHLTFPHNFHQLPQQLALAEHNLLLTHAQHARCAENPSEFSIDFPHSLKVHPDLVETWYRSLSLSSRKLIKLAIAAFFNKAAAGFYLRLVVTQPQWVQARHSTFLCCSLWKSEGERERDKGHVERGFFGVRKSQHFNLIIWIYEQTQFRYA